ncbi:MAG: fluoride efflux transporter CrcB [Bacteroidetes bacterium]|nr:fluoride efflux transporter CrcB [Bacteroidota bacterium]
MINLFLVFVGGGFGCIVRYLISVGFQKTTLTLPWATFVANVTACILFAFALWLMQAKDMNTHALKLLFITGFCGGLSTFSSFGYETFLLLKQAQFFYAGMNILFNTLACLFIFYIFKAA